MILRKKPKAKTTEEEIEEAEALAAALDETDPSSTIFHLEALRSATAEMANRRLQLLKEEKLANIQAMVCVRLAGKQAEGDHLAASVRAAQEKLKAAQKYSKIGLNEGKTLLSAIFEHIPAEKNDDILKDSKTILSAIKRINGVPANATTLDQLLTDLQKELLEGILSGKYPYWVYVANAP